MTTETMKENVDNVASVNPPEDDTIQDELERIESDAPGVGDLPEPEPEFEEETTDSDPMARIAPNEELVRPEPEAIKADDPTDELLAKREWKPVKIEGHHYWCGLVEECPLENAHVGGVAFQKMTQKVTTDDNGKTMRSDKPGQFLFLKKKSLERVIERAQGLIIRRYGNDESARYTLHDIENPRFSPMESDEPIGRYIYIVPIASKNVVLNLDKPPDTLIE